MSLSDFDVDMFLRFEDENIYIYYSDFESIPHLANLVPLGSFDDEGRYKLINLPMATRIEIGLEFMLRDLYATKEPITEGIRIVVDQFLTEFATIPEVVNSFDKFLSMCSNPVDPLNPPSWCTTCGTTTEIECVNHCVAGEPCATLIPIEEFTEEELYYLTIVYFNGIYRTSPENAQSFQVYDILTDVDFDLNKYTLIVDIKEFFTKEFQYFLKTMPGSTPFANDYGTSIKLAVQTKNTRVQKIFIENEINFFIIGFNNLYGDLVNISKISIRSNESDIGADTWVIDVHASVTKDRLVYRIEV